MSQQENVNMVFRHKSDNKRIKCIIISNFDITFNNTKTKGATSIDAAPTVNKNKKRNG